MIQPLPTTSEAQKERTTQEPEQQYLPPPTFYTRGTYVKPSVTKSPDTTDSIPLLQKIKKLFSKR